jgi:putative transposase
VWAVDF